MNKRLDDFLDLLDPSYLQSYINRKACQAPIEELGPGKICGEKDCGSAERFDGMSKDEIFYLRAKEDVARTIIKLCKALLIAENKLDIDMGDGEKTFQCCNAVCGHVNCIVGDGVELAKSFIHLSEDEEKKYNTELKKQWPAVSMSIWKDLQNTGGSLPKPTFIHAFKDEISLEWFLCNETDDKISFFWTAGDGVYALLSSKNGAMEDCEGDKALEKILEWFESCKNNQCIRSISEETKKLAGEKFVQKSKEAAENLLPASKEALELLNQCPEVIGPKNFNSNK